MTQIEMFKSKEELMKEATERVKKRMRRMMDAELDIRFGLNGTYFCGLHAADLIKEHEERTNDR